MGGIASWWGKAAGTSGAQRGSLQGLPLYLWGRARIFRGHGNAALGLQCQGNVSPKAKPSPLPPQQARMRRPPRRQDAPFRPLRLQNSSPSVNLSVKFSIRFRKVRVGPEGKCTPLSP